ncbi:heparin lyase I family protein [Crocinitomix catalasitica]|uniref:heparin lyase I family protein n=1 Tax=Crocinitomix catalasitica TaxID=184607 RepID=UPI0004853DD6|nr:heparin lyase I family protein [Crocinitomix catalasitica]
MHATKSFISIALTCLIFSCKKDAAEIEKAPLQDINFGFETVLEDWVAYGGGGERNDPDDVMISTDTKIEGEQSCKFTISPESIVAGGNRAELTFDQKAIEGDDTWYEYSFYIPVDYEDVDLRDAEDRVNWQVLGQWHHQPVFDDGEDWIDYTGKNASPPIGIYYNHFDTTDIHYKNILSDPEATSVYGFNPDWHDVSTISIVYGGKSIAIREITKGEWHRLKFNILWAENNSGTIQVWLDGTALTDGKVSGKNMLNSSSHYFKFGIYRNPTIPYVNHLYYDDVKIWHE